MLFYIQCTPDKVATFRVATFPGTKSDVLVENVRHNAQ